MNVDIESSYDDASPSCSADTKSSQISRFAMRWVFVARVYDIHLVDDTTYIHNIVADDVYVSTVWRSAVEK